MRPAEWIAVLGLAAALAAPAALSAEGGRASAAPGVSQDGSGPGEGAIQGGSIESKKGSDSPLERRKEIDRCRELEGTLREQCLADARSERVVPPPAK